MNRPVIRPATKADILAFYPDMRWTFRAYVAELEDELLGIGGIYYEDDGKVVAFSFGKEGAREKYPLTNGRMIVKIMKLIRDHHCLAVTGEIPGAAAFLKRLGFEQYEGRIFKHESSR